MSKENSYWVTDKIFTKEEIESVIGLAASWNGDMEVNPTCHLSKDFVIGRWVNSRIRYNILYICLHEDGVCVFSWGSMQLATALLKLS